MINHCTMGLSTAQILLNFDQNLMNLFGTDEKLSKDSGESVSVKSEVLMDEKHEGSD